MKKILLFVVILLFTINSNIVAQQFIYECNKIQLYEKVNGKFVRTKVDYDKVQIRLIAPYILLKTKGIDFSYEVTSIKDYTKDIVIMECKDGVVMMFGEVTILLYYQKEDVMYKFSISDYYKL